MDTSSTPWAKSFCPFRAYWVISTVQVDILDKTKIFLTRQKSFLINLFYENILCLADSFHPSSRRWIPESSIRNNRQQCPFCRRTPLRIRHSCPASPNACSHCPGSHLPPHQGRLDSRGDKQLWRNVTGKSNTFRLAP